MIGSRFRPISWLWSQWFRFRYWYHLSSIKRTLHYVRHPIGWWRWMHVSWFWDGFDEGYKTGLREGKKIGLEEGYYARNGLSAPDPLTEGDEQYQYTDLGGL